MNITWKEDSDGSKRVYVDRGEIIVRKDHGGFAVVIYTKRFSDRGPIIFRPFETEAEAMIMAHMLIENHRHDLFQLRSFKTLRGDVVGYKAVILYNSFYDFFTSRILKVTIPKGTIVHYPDIPFPWALLTQSKFRAKDAIINYIVGDYGYPIDNVDDDYVILSAHCCGQVLGPFNRLSTFYNWSPEEFIKQVKNQGGVYSEGMSIHIPDFSWEDNECGEGFHYFLTCDEARRYSIRFAGIIKALNRYVNKKEERL